MSGRDETESDLVAMLMADEGMGRVIQAAEATEDPYEPYDVRLDAKPAPAHQIKDLKRSRALNEWLVLDREGRRFRKGRLVCLDGARLG